MQTGENKIIFEGSCVALVTPMRGGKIDFDAFARLIEFQIENGTKAIVVLGTTGEPSTMSAKEKIEVTKFAVQKIAGRVKCIVGTGGNNTKQVIADSLRAKKLCADALLIVTPYYNKCTQAGLIAHYKIIADTVKHPIIIYNVPARTGLNMLPQTAAQICESEWIVGVKEASGDLVQLCELMLAVKGKAAIYSGEDALNFAALCVGAAGTISVTANALPAQISALCEAVKRGKLAAARAIHEKIFGLNRALFCEVSPAPIKALLADLGLVVGEIRMPLLPCSENNARVVFENYEKAVKYD